MTDCFCGEEQEKQIPVAAAAALNDPWGTFISIGGPKAHVRLCMTGTLFISLLKRGPCVLPKLC
jgi:hypothetical protein